MKKVLTTPLRDEDLADLKIGDVVYLTGRLVTCRDVAHRRLIEPVSYTHLRAHET